MIPRCHQVQTCLSKLVISIMSLTGTSVDFDFDGI